MYLWSLDYEPIVCAYDQAATIWLDEELEDNNSCLSHVPALSSGRRQWEARSVFIEKGTDDCFSLVDRRFYQCRGAGSLFSHSGHYRQARLVTGVNRQENHQPVIWKSQ